MATEYIEKRVRLADPVATAGDRLYVICSQNGLFPDPWDGHVPHEMWGIWSHPIKLLDGFWLALRNPQTQVVNWLLEADACRIHLGYTEFDYRIGPLRVTRRDVAPDGMEGLIVTVTVQAPSGFQTPLELIAIFRSDLRPAWLGERVGMEDQPDDAVISDSRGDDGRPTIDDRGGRPDNGSYLKFSDRGNPWFVLVGGEAAGMAMAGPTIVAPHQTKGQGATGQWVWPLAVAVDQPATLRFFVAGSSNSEAAALETFVRLKARHVELFAEKTAFYSRLAQQSQLITSHAGGPDAALNDAFLWSKLNCQMLARTTEAHGAGVGAGLPVYPWWFGIDTEYAVLPMLQAGLFELVKSSLRLLKTVSEQHNSDTPGRVIHELTTTGVVFNPGNLVETPIFTRAVHQTWRWTGDRVFLEEMYPFCKQGLLAYTLGQCDPDGDLCPSGRSIIETLEMHADFECLDVACYTWEALTLLAELARAVGDAAIVPELEAKAATLGQRIRTEWWLPQENLFADVRASVQQVQTALQRIDQWETDPAWQWMAPQAAQAHRLFDPALAARVNAVDDLDLPWLLRHWVMICPLEVGLATPQQARQALDRLLSPEFCNEWGMYLHPERHDVMSINTGILALAAARYGRSGQAHKLVQHLAATHNVRTPGAISEALPDKWCFLQLWSAVGVISPVVENFLGIEPNAGDRKLRVIPNLPAGWDEAALKQVRVGEYAFDIEISHRTAPNTHYSMVSVSGEAPDFSISLGVYIPDGFTPSEVYLRGEPCLWRIETTNAGRCLVCDAPSGQAELLVKLVSL